MNGLPPFDWGYTSASMADSQTIWIIGERSVYRTTDLGMTWTEANRPADSLAYPRAQGFISALDSSNAIAAAYQAILRTSDGGMTWHRVFEDGSVSPFFNVIDMVTDSVGFALGDAPNDSSPPAVLRTSDAGWTWEVLSTNLPAGYFQYFGISTDFVSPLVGWSYQHWPRTGDVGLFKTTDGGLTWQRTPAPRGYGLCFIDDSIGLTCPGDYAPLSTFRTTDGGFTWDDKGLAGRRYVLSSPAGDRLWSGPMASDDSGDTWYEQRYPVGSWENGSFYNKHFGVLVGSSVIVTTTGGSEVVDVESNDRIPAVCSLEQNYPNPFNPTTTIEYALPHTGHLTLSIYSLLGEEVARLVDGEQAAGVFRTTWDASAMPSGVYFCRLMVGGFVHTKAMVLMR